MAVSILSLGMLTPLALSTATRRRGLKLMSPPLILAATVISLAILEKAAPRFSSWRPLRCWILAHLLCPAIAITFRERYLNVERRDFTRHGNAGEKLPTECLLAWMVKPVKNEVCPSFPYPNF